MQFNDGDGWLVAYLRLKTFSWHGYLLLNTTFHPA
jgi:hypothetical protein